MSALYLICLKLNYRLMLKQVLTIWAGAFLLSTTTSCSSTKEQNASFDSTSTETIDNLSVEEPELNYVYSEKIDEMTDAKIKFASIRSENTVELNYPYGECALTYCVRKNSNGVNDVYLVLSSGQFSGGEYDGSNYVMVRFDDFPATKYTFSEAADGSSDIIFLNNTKDFIRRAKKATKIKIEVPLFQEGNRLFRFSASKPLVWE